MKPQKGQIIRPTHQAEAELPPREKIIPQDGREDQADGGEVGEDGDEASDRSAFHLEPGGLTIVVQEDGTLRPVRAEALVLAWADGFRGIEAWRVSGGGSASYRSRIESNEVFRKRVAELAEERAKIETEGVLGEALWAAKQNWRLARQGGVVAEIHRATVLLVEVTRQMGGVAPARDDEGVPPAEGQVARRGPGRPPKEPSALNVGALQMREALIHKGITVAPPPEATQ